MKIVVGFSGGVDSAVTTRLLQRAGHQVYGLYMDNMDEKARQEAIASAQRMGIELTVADVKAELEEKVCRPLGRCRHSCRNPDSRVLRSQCGSACPS